MNTFTLTIPGSGSAVSIAHGLPSAPVTIAKIECQSPDAGFATGDLIEVAQCWSAAGPGVLSVAADANSIAAAASVFSQLFIIPKSGGDPVPVDPANWKIRVYAVG